MQKINFIKSRCVVRNNARKAVKVLGRATIPPSEACNLFDVIPNLSEILIVDALRMPDGELYQKSVEGQIEIVECDLVVFNNTNVVPVVQIHKAAEEVRVDAPLYLENGNIKINKVNEYNDGFLSKLDFLDLKRQSFKVTVWQYQDFSNITDITLKIDQFNNFNFDANAIVNGSAFVVSAAAQDELVHRGNFWSKLLKKTQAVKVANHLKDTVILDGSVPTNTTLRVYFLVSALPQEVSANKVLPKVPDIVRRGRIELIEANTVESGKSSVIAGEKRFVNTTVFSKVGVGCEPDNCSLTVAGGIKTDGLTLSAKAQAGLFLQTNSLGQGSWAPVVVTGHDPPNISMPGSLWCKSPENLLYFFDTQIQRWVSSDSECVYVKSSQQVVNNSYLDIINGGYDHSPSMKYNKDFVIKDLEFDTEQTAQLALELHTDGGLLEGGRFEFSGTGKYVVNNVNIIIKAGVPIRFFVNGSSITKPRVKIKIKTIV